MNNRNLPPRGYGYKGNASSERKVSELEAPPLGPGAGTSNVKKPEGRDYQRSLQLDWRMLADAQDYYEALGFTPTEVPWVVDDEAYNLTKPSEALPYRTLGGTLVASAEQSFYQLLLQGYKLGKAQAITPCFRDEVHDTTHSPYFIKLELIQAADADLASLHEMVDQAAHFFSRYTEVAKEVTAEGIDLIATETSMELGSYGFRCVGDHAWIYGTGLALPRFTQAIAPH